MPIKNAQLSYFTKLEALYKKKFGTLPTVSWDSSLDQSLFIGDPDEDDEIQWKVKFARGVQLKGICKELEDFFGSFYFWEMRGEYKKMYFEFPPITSKSEAQNVVNAALDDGNYYFPNKNVVLLASCTKNGNDDLLLFYRQENAELFLYDTDKRFVYPLDFSLAELIGSMEAVI